MDGDRQVGRSHDAGFPMSLQRDVAYCLEAEDGTAIVVRGERIVALEQAQGMGQGRRTGSNPSRRTPGAAADAAPHGRLDLSIALGPGALRPGFINAHDHLHRNHYPRLGEPPYPDAYAWGRDLHDRFNPQIEHARQLGGRDALLFGALKNLLGGATTVVHHDTWEPAFAGRILPSVGRPRAPGSARTRPGSQRRVDIDHHGFPVRVPRLRVAHSLRFERAFDAAVRGDPSTRDRPLCLHLAEGVNRAAADEVRQAVRLGLVDSKLLAVHAVGVDDDGVERLRAANAAVVACPTSNTFLFGRTAPVALLGSGVDILLGTDALLTGAGTLLDELRAARAMGTLDADRLLDAVGRTAARRLGLPEPRLEPGALADLVLLRRPPFEATAADVGLVIVRGMPRLGDECFAELFDRLEVEAEQLDVGGVRKIVAAPLAGAASRVVALSPECGRIFAP